MARRQRREATLGMQGLKEGDWTGYDIWVDDVKHYLNYAPADWWVQLVPAFVIHGGDVVRWRITYAPRPKGTYSSTHRCG